MSRLTVLLMWVLFLVGSLAFGQDDARRTDRTEDTMQPGPAAMKDMSKLEGRMGDEPMMGAKMKGMADQMQATLLEMLGIIERCKGVQGDAAMMEKAKQLKEMGSKKDDEATTQPMGKAKGMPMGMMMNKRTAMRVSKMSGGLAEMLALAKVCDGIQNDEGAMKKADELTSRARTLASQGAKTEKMQKEMEDIKDMMDQPMQRAMGMQYMALLQMREFQEVTRETANLMKGAETVKNDKEMGDRLDAMQDEIKKMQEETDSMMGQCKDMMKKRKDMMEETKEEGKGKAEEMKEEPKTATPVPAK